MNIKKPVVIIIALGIISTGVFLPIKKTEATGFPVVDLSHIGVTISNWAVNFSHRIIDNYEKILLETLKKRVLDQIVNQTINWINGNGDPKFVTDFNGFLRGAGDVAVGDLLQEINLGSMCQPFKLRVQFDLQNTYFGSSPFNQRASCSITRVVENLNNFYTDFNQGGWVGYAELLKPQNNYYGAYLLAEDEASRRQSAAVDVAGREVSAANGFLNTKVCHEWQGVRNSGSVIADNLQIDLVTQPVNSDFDFPDPNNAPPNGTLGADNWRCSPSSETISTPGQLLAGVTTRALNVQTDSIISAQTFQQYAAAIIDAAINRLIKEGVKGFQGILTDHNSQSYTTKYGSGSVDSETQTAGSAYTGATNAEIQSTKSDLQKNLVSLNSTRKDLLTASTSIITLLDASISFQVWCDSPSASGLGLNRVAHSQTCGSYTSSSTTALRTEIDSLHINIDNSASLIDALITEVIKALGSFNKSGGATAQDMIQIGGVLSRAATANLDGSQLATDIQTRLSTAQAGLQQCQVGATPSNCP